MSYELIRPFALPDPGPLVNAPHVLSQRDRSHSHWPNVQRCATASPNTDHDITTVLGNESEHCIGMPKPPFAVAHCQREKHTAAHLPFCLIGLQQGIGAFIKRVAQNRRGHTTAAVQDVGFCLFPVP